MVGASALEVLVEEDLHNWPITSIVRQKIDAYTIVDKTLKTFCSSVSLGARPVSWKKSNGRKVLKYKPRYELVTKILGKLTSTKMIGR